MELTLLSGSGSLFPPLFPWKNIEPLPLIGSDSESSLSNTMLRCTTSEGGEYGNAKRLPLVTETIPKRVGELLERDLSVTPSVCLLAGECVIGELAPECFVLGESSRHEDWIWRNGECSPISGKAFEPDSRHEGRGFDSRQEGECTCRSGDGELAPDSRHDLSGDVVILLPGDSELAPESCRRLCALFSSVNLVFLPGRGELTPVSRHGLWGLYRKGDPWPL